MTKQTLPDHAALLLRVSMGVMFLAHGIILKFVTYTPAGTAQYFESIGFPAITGALVIAAETIGGLMLILGLQVRLVSLAFVPLMVGASLQHVGNGWLFSAEGGGYEFPVFWTAALLVQAMLGAGAFAIENVVGSGRKLEAARVA